MTSIPSVVIDFASLNFATIVPMLMAIIGALVILCVDLVNRNLDKSLYIMLTILFLLVDLGTLIGYSGDVRGFFDLMLVDGISILSQAIMVFASILFIFTTMSKLRFQEFRYPEYFALYLFVVAGFQFMVSSDSLILIFVGLETASMALYTLIAMHNRKNAIEAAIKYFTMGALATAFFAFGSTLFYAVTGTVELGQISEILTNSNFENYPVILLGVVFLLGAIGFKLSLVPYHTWVADVYEGSTATLAGFLSVVPKIAGFVVALRFFEIFLASGDIYVEIILYATVVLTMTIPNIIALLQTDIKRMLAYSSISNAGFAMGAVLIGTTQATNSLFLYWIMFFITNLGAFTMLWLNRDKSKELSSDHSLEKYSGLIKVSPFTASMMGLFFLSLAGVPPFALFWGKMYLIGSAVNAGYIILALIMAINSAIAAYYYLKPIVYMFLKEPVENNNIEYMANSTTAVKTLIGFCAIVTIFSIFFVEPLLNIISYYVQISGY
ncbi:NADH-quinone oxidoreductase subunit NuoN [Halarcobacter anaerophilus]|jgi:NADH-quinone oxidoreductase subunit N|uniref:NADH-quinone oxidoreductase subunit N n=1 Tax=Halarcobacter anaerophilus TaxID=877500 RepID=A0A4Q0XZG0_9BACT|nr:NADH-quinone oxidoreductase subunit NuoN [Halarcobacter anaerophilus]QDF30257.1 NADH:quinone oxidoreductase I, membrane subunit N [Halarcobacter anaerophilus]RXJ62184.1 NADH-quinone oxidoreductase subunit NuoN [Halarcobacter anaerophilus]